MDTVPLLLSLKFSSVEVFGHSSPSLSSKLVRVECVKAHPSLDEQSAFFDTMDAQSLATPSFLSVPPSLPMLLVPRVLEQCCGVKRESRKE